jgi:hypothetical protein
VKETHRQMTFEQVQPVKLDPVDD